MQFHLLANQINLATMRGSNGFNFYTLATKYFNFTYHMFRVCRVIMKIVNIPHMVDTEDFKYLEKDLDPRILGSSLYILFNSFLELQERNVCTTQLRDAWMGPLQRTQIHFWQNTQTGYIRLQTSELEQFVLQINLSFSVKFGGCSLPVNIKTLYIYRPS